MFRRTTNRPAPTPPWGWEPPTSGDIGEPRRQVEAPEPVPERVPEPIKTPAEPVPAGVPEKEGAPA